MLNSGNRLAGAITELARLSSPGPQHHLWPEGAGLVALFAVGRLAVRMLAVRAQILLDDDQVVVEMALQTRTVPPSTTRVCPVANSSFIKNR
jgi:hypothetical protein